MPIVTDEYINLLVPGIEKAFFVGLKEMGPMKRDDLFEVMSTNQAEERYEGIGGFDANPFQQYRETGIIGELTRNKGFDKTFVPDEYVANWTVPRSYLEDRRADLATIDKQGIAEAWYDHVESHAASVFNNAFNTAYPGPDGKPLCASDHPNSPTDSGTSDNERSGSSSVLSYDELDNARVALETRTNDAGNQQFYQADTLIVPPALFSTANALVNSMQKPGGDDNDANVHYQRYTLISWNYLTSNTAWFLCDSRRMKKYLKWFDRIEIGLDVAGIDKNAAQVVYPFRARFDYGWLDWRWVEGSKGA